MRVKTAEAWRAPLLTLAVPPNLREWVLQGYQSERRLLRSEKVRPSPHQARSYQTAWHVQGTGRPTPAARIQMSEEPYPESSRWRGCPPQSRCPPSVEGW